MKRYVLLIFCVSFLVKLSVAQDAAIRMFCPKKYLAKNLVLFYVDNKGFSQIADSIRIQSDTVTFAIPEVLIPDLYSVYIYGLDTHLEFFPESNTIVILDSLDLSLSTVLNSVSNKEWAAFEKQTATPFLKRQILNRSGEKRARSMSNIDSLNFWLDKNDQDERELMVVKEAFIRTHPTSFVSLHFLRSEWYYFKDKNFLEKFDTVAAYHETFNTLLNKQYLNKEKYLPGFLLKDLKGNLYAKEDFSGKFLIIDFWGTWCDPCIRSIPKLRKAYLRLKENKNVAFMSIAHENANVSPERVQKTADKLQMEWIQLINELGSPDSLAKKINIEGFPTLIVVNPDGKILRESTGFAIDETLAELESITR
jgi:thiol-disulfide isomerase/thioredoxin